MSDRAMGFLLITFIVIMVGLLGILSDRIEDLRDTRDTTSKVKIMEGVVQGKMPFSPTAIPVLAPCRQLRPLQTPIG